MRNEQAVLIRKASTAIGVGLLEAALEIEGRKGCSPVLCTEPVALEPPFEVFDGHRVLRGRPAVESRVDGVVAEQEFVTFDVYASDEDILSIAWCETVLRALSVLRGSVVFELFGEHGRVWVRFAVAEDEVSGFRAAVLGHFPALRLRVVEEPFPVGEPVAVGELVPVAPYHRSLTLLGKEGASPLGLAVLVMSELKRGECGVLQVLLKPASQEHDWHYNVENLVEAELRAKEMAQLGGLSSGFSYDSVLPPLLEPSAAEKVRVDVGFYAAVVRYALWGANRASTQDYLQGMRVATGMVRFGNRAWRVLSNESLVGALGADGVRRMVTGRLAHRPGVMLTSREAATLVHVPNARTLEMLACIEQRVGFEWLPLEGDGGVGSACLGVNRFAGEVRPVEVPMETRLRHMYVAGVTGAGKSKLLERVAVDDAFNGVGFCLVDPHGDLCLDILARIPEKRWGDVVYVSFGEQGYVPRWNPFMTDVPPGKFADDFTRSVLSQTSSSGARMEHNIRMLTYVVRELRGTLDDFAELAARSPRGDTLKERALSSIGNAQVQRFLRTDLVGYSSRDLASVTNKLSRLLLDENLGVMFRQAENSLRPRAWMDDGRIVLVNLASGEIGVDHARFAGSLLVSLLYRAGLTRAELPPSERRPFIVYIDEFQQLQAATLGELLSEGRKYGLGAVLAHQERGQLGKDLAQALGNCATKVGFRCAEDDLPHFRRVFGGRAEPDTLRSLGVGQALVSCHSRLASLATQLTEYPRLRDPRQAARNYVRRHYLRVDGDREVVRVRRPRVYDTFGDA